MIFAAFIVLINLINLTLINLVCFSEFHKNFENEHFIYKSNIYKSYFNFPELFTAKLPTQSLLHCGGHLQKNRQADINENKYKV